MNVARRWNRWMNRRFPDHSASPGLVIIRTGSALLLALILSMGALEISAHRGHAVWTDIHWASDGFEIVHRMHVADAITINRFMGGKLPIDDLQSLALVALYVEERFLLSDAATDVGLETLGAEIEEDFLFVYQEWAAPLTRRFPAIDNRLLLDVEPHSQAFIRIKGPGLDEERVR